MPDLLPSYSTRYFLCHFCLSICFVIVVGVVIVAIVVIVVEKRLVIDKFVEKDLFQLRDQIIFSH